jgi:hypothetical protein
LLVAQAIRASPAFSRWSGQESRDLSCTHQPSHRVVCFLYWQIWVFAMGNILHFGGISM